MVVKKRGVVTALVNELLDNRMDTINTVLVVVEQNVKEGQDWSRRHTDAVRGMEVDVGGLMTLTAFMRGEMDQMRREMDSLLQLNIRMHKVIMELRTAVTCPHFIHPTFFTFLHSLVTPFTLGAEGVLPSRHIESFLRVFKQLTHNLSSRQVMSYLSICPPL